MSLKIFRECLVAQVRKWRDFPGRTSVNFTDAWNKSNIAAVAAFAERVNGEVDNSDTDGGFVISNDKTIYKVTLEENKVKLRTWDENETEEVQSVYAMTEEMHKMLFPAPKAFDLKEFYMNKIRKLLNKKRNDTQERKLAEYRQKLLRLKSDDGGSGSGSGSGKN